MTLRALIVVLLWALQFLSISHGGSTDKSSPIDVGSILIRSQTAHEIPAMVAVVLKGDKVIGSAAVGVRKRDSDIGVTLDDQFHLGSCTKAMTATLAGMLVDEDKLNWTNTLSDLFGDVVKEMHPAWKPVTVRQLLVHRGGLPSGNDPGVGLDPRDVPTNKSLMEIRELLVATQLRHAPEAVPGTKEVYSNVGYIIVGAALEKLCGTSWEKLMEDRIFKPLGMKTAGFGAPGTPGRTDEPWGHDRTGKPIEPGQPNSDLPAYSGPCGTVHMAIADWAKFVAVHLRGDPSNPNRFVSLVQPQTIADLHHANAGELYAPGWATGTADFAKGSRPSDTGKLIGHEGNNGYWYSKVLVAPEIDLAVLVACNRGGARFGGKAVAEAAVELLREFAGHFEGK